MAAVLKFLPLLYSLTHGFDLQYLPPDDVRHTERSWALDLVSDTGFLLLVWFLISQLNFLLVGERRLVPWRTSPALSLKKKTMERPQR